ncbi:MAG: transglycosylase [Alphaproteobacteria bacterium PA2]|nr:MAG: transglycosylase [Alphaproteobacteria bacterium PA2]
MTVALAVLASSAARAQVIEISADGQTEVISGPVVTTDSGRSLIAAPVNPSQIAVARPAARADVVQAIQETSAAVQISDRLIEAVAWQESRLNQTAVSPKGARGVMQLMPGTASQLGVQAEDMRDNIKGGAVYLKQLLGQFDNDLVLTLAAYNAGPAAVRKYGGVPPYRETQAYVAAILARLAASEASTLVARSRP